MKLIKISSILTSLVLAAGVMADSGEARADNLYVHGTSCAVVSGQGTYSSLGMVNNSNVPLDLICPVNSFGNGTGATLVEAIVTPQDSRVISCTLTMVNSGGQTVYTATRNTQGATNNKADALIWQPNAGLGDVYGIISCTLPGFQNAAPFFTGYLAESP